MSAETAASVCGLKWSDTVVGPHECKDAPGHKPGVHSCVCGTYLVGDGGRPGPWRLDVPEVPDSVTALQSVERIYELDDHRWVRMPGDRWAPIWPDGRIGTARLSLIALAAYAPLVECEDPRGTG